MKILHILDQVNRGGTETLVLDTCRNAKINNLDLVFVTCGKGDLFDEFKNSGVKFYYLPRKYPLDISLIWELRKILKESKINIIHTHQAVTGIHAYLASFGMGIKLVQTLHGYLPSAKKDNFILKLLVKKFDINFAVSKGSIERLREQSKIKKIDRFKVLYNGIDLKKLDVKESTLREELNIPPNVMLAGMIGNFVPWKDQLTICKALKLIKDDGFELKFVFVGNIFTWYINYFNIVYKYCEENSLLDDVIFLGKREDIGNILKALNLFVYSSIEDTFGIALIEAMAAGVPTIASDIPPLKEVSGNGKYSVLFKTKDEVDLFKKMKHLLLNYRLFKVFAQEGKDYVTANFSISVHLKNLLSFYNSLK